MSENSVLLVDDEEEFVETLAERLEVRGLSVDTADSGPKAIEKVENKWFDAVLLDLSMPGMDGIETLRRMREINADIHVVLLTGHATVDTAIVAMKEGAADVLQKPADIENLVERIEFAATEKHMKIEERAAEQLQEILKKKGW